MTDYHIFNGDADGICAMVQLYRAAPNPDAVIITGRKRDIKLLDRVEAGQGDHLTVLDISMRSNMDALLRQLKNGAKVFYADHHNAGNIPEHDNLDAHINMASEICTAILVDQHLGGAYRAWAVCASFGDNFPAAAKRLAHGYDLPLAKLERLGILLNYNGYGASVEDLHFDPAELYKILRGFDSPMEFLLARPDIFSALDEGYSSDMEGAKAARILSDIEGAQVLQLPDRASSRRVSGVYGNQLAQDNPDRAHAILTDKEGGYVVSVRAPLSDRMGADKLCIGFDTGGGRAAAAGINHLPHSDVQIFIDAFNVQYGNAQ